MGKGDNRSKKGKISTSSFGKSRAHKDRNIVSRLTNPAEATTAKAKKAPAKKKK